MNFEGLQARYGGLIKQGASWRLLRADNAPYILAFMEELFAEQNEVPFARARVALEATLEIAGNIGWETDISATAYLRQWSDAGWLRDLDDLVSMTDASEQALRFVKSLSNRGVSTSASHLRIVQDNVRDLAIQFSASPDEKIQRIEKQISDLELEIDGLRSGKITELSENQKREMIQELYQQASILTGDFRRVEDDMREMDQAVRVEMIQGDSTKGDILEGVLDYETRLVDTESGSAFFGFHALLQDENRTMEFRQELQGVLNSDAAGYLSKSQSQSLKHLMRNLNKESDRVLEIRRRHSQGLRAYIESGAAQENKAVNLLLSELEKHAIQLRESNHSAQEKLNLKLKVGKAELFTPTSIRLKNPDDTINTEGVEEQKDDGDISLAVLKAVQAVQAKKVAKSIRSLVRREGPLTIAGIVGHLPIKKGLEELTAIVRVAKSVGAVELEDKELIIFTDRDGIEVKANIPRFLVSSDLFPGSIEELNL